MRESLSGKYKLFCTFALQIITFFLFTNFLYAADPNIMPASTGNYIIGPCTISVPGTYKLAQDIIGTITIAADDVILDLNERIIQGQISGYSIEIYNQKNIELYGGTIRGEGTLFPIKDVGGIFIESSTAISLHDLIIQDTTHFDPVFGPVGCITTLFCSTIDIQNCTLQKSTSGMIILSTDDINIISGHITDAVGAAIAIASSSSCIIQNCIMKNNAQSIGIRLSQNVNIINCSIIGDLISPGIFAQSVETMCIDNCCITKCNNGISVFAQATNCVVKNTVLLNNNNGINNNSTSTSFFGNKAQGNISANYVGVPLATIVDFSLSTGLYSTVPFTSCNISVVP